MDAISTPDALSAKNTAAKVEKPSAAKPVLKDILRERSSKRKGADLIFNRMGQRNFDLLSANKSQNPLDSELASFFLLNNLRPGDAVSFDLPIPGGPTYQITGVDSAPDGSIQLKTAGGFGISLQDALGKTLESIQVELPPTAANEPAEIRFVRAYLASLRPGGGPVDATVLKEAAQAVKLFTSDDLVEVAQNLGFITKEDADLLVHPEKLEEPMATQPIVTPDARAQTDANTAKPLEPIKPSLSENAHKLQKLLENTVPGRQEIEQVLETIGIPYNRESIVKRVQSISKEINENKIRIEHPKDSDEAVRLTNKNKALESEASDLANVSSLMSKYEGNDGWNVLDGIDRWISSENFPPDLTPGGATGLIITGMKAGNVNAVLTTLVGEQKMSEVIKNEQTKERFEQIKHYAMYGGGGIAAILSIMAFFGMKQGNERG